MFKKLIKNFTSNGFPEAARSTRYKSSFWASNYNYLSNSYYNYLSGVLGNISNTSPIGLSADKTYWGVLDGITTDTLVDGNFKKYEQYSSQTNYIGPLPLVAKRYGRIPKDPESGYETYDLYAPCLTFSPRSNDTHDYIAFRCVPSIGIEYSLTNFNPVVNSLSKWSWSGSIQWQTVPNLNNSSGIYFGLSAQGGGGAGGRSGTNKCGGGGGAGGAGIFGYIDLEILYDLGKAVVIDLGYKKQNQGTSNQNGTPGCSSTIYVYQINESISVNVPEITIPGGTAGDSPNSGAKGGVNITKPYFKYYDYYSNLIRYEYIDDNSTGNVYCIDTMPGIVIFWGEKGASGGNGSTTNTQYSGYDLSGSNISFPHITDRIVRTANDGSLCRGWGTFGSTVTTGAVAGGGGGASLLSHRATNSTTSNSGGSGGYGGNANASTAWSGQNGGYALLTIYKNEE